jgi:hypothetical protein
MLMATQFVENLLESQQKTVDIRIQASHIFSRPLFRQNSMCDIRTQALICKPFVYDEAMEHLNKVEAKIKETLTGLAKIGKLYEDIQKTDYSGAKTRYNKENGRWEMVDDNEAKVQWNEEDGGWEDICGDCNKPWCEGGEYGGGEQWFCKDCYVEPDYEHNVDYCDSCYMINRHREPPYALCYKCEEKEK